MYISHWLSFFPPTFPPLFFLADFELTQLQEKLKETEMVMEKIVSKASHSPERFVSPSNLFVYISHWTYPTELEMFHSFCSYYDYISKRICHTNHFIAVSNSETELVDERSVLSGCVQGTGC